MAQTTSAGPINQSHRRKFATKRHKKMQKESGKAEQIPHPRLLPARLGKEKGTKKGRQRGKKSLSQTPLSPVRDKKRSEKGRQKEIEKGNGKWKEF